MGELLTINERIKYAIKKEGHTVATFARKCGVADSTLRNLLLRDYKPSYDLIVSVIKAVDKPWCDANWLVMGKTTAPEPEDQDTRKLLKLVADQQRTIEEQRKRIDALTDRLLNEGK